MPGTLKLIYKPDPKSTDEYFIIVNADEYQTFKEEQAEKERRVQAMLEANEAAEGEDEEAPQLHDPDTEEEKEEGVSAAKAAQTLTDIVAAHNFWWSNQGTQGHLDRPANYVLETIFGSAKDEVVILRILERAQREQPMDDLDTSGVVKNVSRGGDGKR